MSETKKVNLELIKVGQRVLLQSGEDEMVVFCGGEDTFTLTTAENSSLYQVCRRIDIADICDSRPEHISDLEELNGAIYMLESDIDEDILPQILDILGTISGLFREFFRRECKEGGCLETKAARIRALQIIAEIKEEEDREED